MADGELGSYSRFMPSFALFLPNIDPICPRLRLVIFDPSANGLTSDILGHGKLYDWHCSRVRGMQASGFSVLIEIVLLWFRLHTCKCLIVLLSDFFDSGCESF